VSNHEITTDDMARMRREGSMRDYLRLVSRPSAGPVRGSGPRVSEAMPADHIPGAWPVGTCAEGSGARICPCPQCAQYAEGRPENDTAPESA
jgi:hypothetical protein